MIDRRPTKEDCVHEENMSSSVPSPKSIGREFIRCYYTVLNKSPENLHCFYNDAATFIHDDIDPMVQRTISVVGKQAIRHVMKTRLQHYRHNCTIINGIDTVATINNGLVVQVFGEIAHNGDQRRPFSQSFVLMAVLSKYYVLNEIFRFRDFLPEMKRTTSETESIAECSKAMHVSNATFMDDANEPMSDNDDDASDSNNMTPETINELQTKLLKSILQETRPPNNRKQIESAVTVAAAAPMKQISNETAKQLFQDNCIITIGSVVNPNIKFDADNSTEAAVESPPKIPIESQTATATCTEPQLNLTSKSSQKNSPKSQPKTSIESQPTAVVDLQLEDLPKIAAETKEKSGRNENANVAEAVEEKGTVEVTHAPPEVIEEAEKVPIVFEAVETKPKSYAELLKLARERSRSASSSSRSSSGDHRNGSFSSIKDKPLIIRNSLRRKSDKQAPPNRDVQSRSDNILQVFIGNIVQNGSEEDLRRMFSKFGTISRFRIHSNPDKCWLPHYAFVTYENIDAVRRCLAKRNSLYFPVNAANRLKLNVNGDESIIVDDEEKPKVTVVSAEKTAVSNNQPSKRRRELKQFHKNFVISMTTTTATETKVEPVAVVARKIEPQIVKTRQTALENGRIHGGRNQLRRISGKA